MVPKLDVPGLILRVRIVVSRFFCAIEIGFIELELIRDVEPVRVDRHIPTRARVVIHHIPTLVVVNDCVVLVRIGFRDG